MKPFHSSIARVLMIGALLCLGLDFLCAADRKPNVVIILADDLGYGDLPCYGHPRFKTPHLDRMAAEGARLTQFNCPMPYCAPTRASLLTGRYPFRCGLTDNPSPDFKPKANDWRYGVARYDAAAHTLRAFVELKFAGAIAKPGAPMPRMGNLKLSADGGESGATADLASVRRWVAPYPGRVDIAAELSHSAKTGHGVTARVLHGRLGLLGEWKAANSSQVTELKEIQVQKGDTLDFFVTSGSEAKEDAYRWAPTILMPEREIPGMFGMAMRWDARANFQDPTKAPIPLGPWEELAQVLLMSNEFATLE